MRGVSSKQNCTITVNIVISKAILAYLSTRLFVTVTVCSIYFVTAIYRSQAITVKRNKEYVKVNSKTSADIKNNVQKFMTYTFWSTITPKTIVKGIETVQINRSASAKLQNRMLKLLCNSCFCRIAMSTRTFKRMVTGQAMDVTTTADCRAEVACEQAPGEDGKNFGERETEEFGACSRARVEVSLRCNINPWEYWQLNCVDDAWWSCLEKLPDLASLSSNLILMPNLPLK